MSCAPIVLFVYNRPEHTYQTIQALLKNALASESDLYVFSDGPRSEEPSEKKQINKVRFILSETRGFKSLTIIESYKNKGLAASIVDGVSQIVDKHGKVIVLEDDILTSAGFLTFMNKALSLYENDDEVAHVSGYAFPIKSRRDHYFLSQTHCWGWGTWKRAWTMIDLDSERLLNQIISGNKSCEFNLWDSCDYVEQLKQNINKTKNTWAVKWYASCFLANALALHPQYTLCKNIGFDGSGVNSGWQGYNQDFDPNRTNSISKRSPKKDIDEEKKLITYFKKRKTNTFNQRLGLKMSHLFDKFESLLDDLYKSLISIHPKIDIHPRARISYKCSVRVKFGGSIQIGADSEILEGAKICSYGGNIRIGERCSINYFSVIYGHGGVVIGDDVLIAGHTMVIPSNHNFSSRTAPIQTQGNTSLGITIMDDVWIGHSCSILDGVVVGTGSVIGAGSIVNRSLPAYGVYAGVPATEIKKRNSDA